MWDICVVAFAVLLTPLTSAIGVIIVAIYAFTSKSRSIRSTIVDRLNAPMPEVSGARGGTRTHTTRKHQRILSPPRMPFRHPGRAIARLAHRGTRCNIENLEKRKQSRVTLEAHWNPANLQFLRENKLHKSTSKKMSLWAITWVWCFTEMCSSGDPCHRNPAPAAHFLPRLAGSLRKNQGGKLK